MVKICLATGNENKLKEIRYLFRDLNINWTTLSDFQNIPDIIEDKSTFEENALKKATEIYEFTNLLTIADDSGLEVDALGGAPGVFSARFAGKIKNDSANNKKLTSMLLDVPAHDRTARFRCAAAIVNSEIQKVYEGTIEGHVLLSPRGSSGFGYDPIFIPAGYHKTFAELGSETKNRISHRAKAFLALKQFLNIFLKNQ